MAYGLLEVSRSWSWLLRFLLIFHQLISLMCFWKAVFLKKSNFGRDSLWLASWSILLLTHASLACRWTSWVYHLCWWRVSLHFLLSFLTLGIVFFSFFLPLRCSMYQTFTWNLHKLSSLMTSDYTWVVLKGIKHSSFSGLALYQVFVHSNLLLINTTKCFLFSSSPHTRLHCVVNTRKRKCWISNFCHDLYLAFNTQYDLPIFTHLFLKFQSCVFNNNFQKHWQFLNLFLLYLNWLFIMYFLNKLFLMFAVVAHQQTKYTSEKSGTFKSESKFVFANPYISSFEEIKQL